jgi:uncharacterized membrane protein
MGFYTVTDGGRLAEDHVLEGADWIGYAVCHRITARSFSINGRQLPLCARCTGMYLGVFLTFVVLTMSGRIRRSELPPLRLSLLLAAFVGLMGIDGLNSYLHFFAGAPGLYEPHNWLRLVTGMGTGLAMGLFVFPALAQTVWREADERPVIGSYSELGGMLLLAAAAVFLVLGNQPAILYVLALASTAGVLMSVTSIQAVLLLILFRRDGQAKRWLDAALPLGLGLLLAAVEIGAISLARFSLTGTMAGFPGL